MPAQPTTLPPAAPVPSRAPVSVAPTPPPPHPTSPIQLGIALALVGVVLEGVFLAWNYFGLPFIIANGSTAGFATYLRVQAGLFAAESLFSSVGIYLILTWILRILPRASRWAAPGPLLVLIGGLLLALLGVVEFAITANSFPPTGASLPEWVGEAEEAVSIAGALVGALGLVLALVAIVRGALVRVAPPSPTIPG